MHKTYLPEVDPLFDYASKVHSVPVPWTCKDVQNRMFDEENRTLGLEIVEESSPTDNENEQRKKVVIKQVHGTSKARLVAGE